MKKLAYSLVIYLLIFSFSYAQFWNYNNFDYFFDGYIESPVLRYETQVDSPNDCTRYESYNYWNNTCYFECFEGQDCTNKLNAVNKEIEYLSQMDPGIYYPAEDFNFTDANLIAEYNVLKGENLKFVKGKDASINRSLWLLVSYISPDAITDAYISKFRVYNNPDSGAIAFVDSDDQTGKKIFAVNLPTFRSSDLREKILTIVHELGHVLSLNKGQVNANVTEAKCEYFFSSDGCFYKQSLLNLFVFAFWPQADLDQTAYSPNGLYEANPSKYVDEYASTNETEDFAETFAYFVLNNRQNAANKIAFMEKDPRLVKMKNEMLNGIKRVLVEENLTK